MIIGIDKGASAVKLAAVDGDNVLFLKTLVGDERPLLVVVACITLRPLAGNPVARVLYQWRWPLVVMLVPWNTLFAFAEKPRPKPPARPAMNAWVTSEPSRETTRPRTPVFPPKARKPFTSDTA